MWNVITKCDKWCADFLFHICCGLCKHQKLDVGWFISVMTWFTELYKKTSFFKLMFSQFIKWLVMYKPLRESHRTRGIIFSVRSLADEKRLMNPDTVNIFLGLSHLKDKWYCEWKKVKSVPSYILFQHLLKTFQNISYTTTVCLCKEPFKQTTTSRQGLVY